MEKKLIFKKGIRRIVFPILLHEFDSWQNQILDEMNKIKGKFLPRKRVEWGFKIENGYAEIYVRKV